MGEVFRARDTKLGRDVAIKVLPAALAQDAERVGREAQILATLNHPNIAAIYGLEEANGTVGLVMELVAGAGVSETRAVCQCICATGERRWASGRRSPGAGGCSGRPSEGLRTRQNPAVREVPPPRWNSVLPYRSLRCLVASVVVSAIALVTERLSP